MENSNLPVAVDPAQFNVSLEMAADLTKGLEQIKSEKSELIKEYDRILKLDINDPETWSEARKVRLKIRDNRTKGIAVWHKNKKEIFLRGGQFIDAIKRDESDENQRMEANLEEIEKHEEILRQKELDKRMEKRIPLIEPYKEFIPIGINIREILDDDFEKLLNGAKMQFDAKIEAERKAEEERIAKEKSIALHNERKEMILPYWDFVPIVLGINNTPRNEFDFSTFTESEWEERLEYSVKEKEKYEAEQARIKSENERLKKEAEAKEKALQAEREKARKEAEALKAKRQAELKAERDKQAKLEAELRAKREAEEKAEAERLAEIEKQKKEAEELAKAPVKKQLNAWVDLFSLPETNVNHNLKNEIEQKFEAFKKWSKNQINNL